jgi:hypothetical protein
VADTPSRQTLDLAPGRCITFVIAVAKYPAIAATLAEKGYDQQETDFVWTRLSILGSLPVSGQKAGKAEAEVQAAVRELDAWDEKNFAAIKAILARTYPAFNDVIFRDLEPKEGPEAVDSVATLLNRLDQLGTSPDQDAPAVLKLLAKRGYPDTERKRLRDLVDLSKKFAPKAPLDDKARVQILTELHGWISDWSTTAHNVITRRQHLIALGIASPRKHEPEVPAPAEEPAKAGTAAKIAPVLPAAPATEPAAPAGDKKDPPKDGK